MSGLCIFQIYPWTSSKLNKYSSLKDFDNEWISVWCFDGNSTWVFAINELSDVYNDGIWNYFDWVVDDFEIFYVF